MAKEEKKPGKFSEEGKLSEIVNKAHGEIADSMNGRPYLLVVATGYEIGKEGEKSLLAAQWAWRSNVYKDKEEGGKLMTFLISQLPDVLDDSEIGVRKSYAPETGRKK